jgi:hypothetical protein
MTKPIDNTEDIIDSRDVIDRIEELRSEVDDLLSESMVSMDFDEFVEGVCDRTLEILLSQEFSREDASTLEDLCDELWPLMKLAEQGEGYGDWDSGETLIRDSYFEEYAKELAKDIGSVSGDEKWPLNHIAWEDAADELKTDYTELDFDGVAYQMRA